MSGRGTAAPAATEAPTPPSAQPFDLTTVMDHRYEGIAPGDVEPLRGAWTDHMPRDEAEQRLRGLYSKLNWLDGQDTAPPPGLPPATAEQREAYLAELDRRSPAERGDRLAVLRHAAHVRAWLRRLDWEARRQAEDETQRRVERLGAMIDRYVRDAPSLAEKIRAAEEHEAYLIRLAEALDGHCLAENARRQLSSLRSQATDAARELGLELDPDEHEGEVTGSSQTLRDLHGALGRNYY